MSVQSEIERIQKNVASTYNVLEEAGAEMPQSRNTNNLPETAGSIKAVLYTAQSLTESQKAQAKQNLGIASTEEIIQQVITALGTPVFGRVDADNNIILTGELTDGTYTLKYEDADGNLTEIGDLEIGAAIVNLLPISTDASGAVYNSGDTPGYKNGYRLSTGDGLTEKTNSATSLTGYIPVANGDVIRLANMSFIKDSADAYKGMVYTYSALGVYISHVDTTSVIGSWNGVTDSNGNVAQFTVMQEGVAFIRITAAEITDSSIITKNQEIV